MTCFLKICQLQKSPSMSWSDYVRWLNACWYFAPRPLYKPAPFTTQTWMEVRTIHVGDGSPDALPADVRSMLVFDEVRKVRNEISEKTQRGWEVSQWRWICKAVITAFCWRPLASCKMRFYTQVGQAGGGSFKMEKNYKAKKECAYIIECARVINQCDANTAVLLWWCAVVVMWPVLMCWGWLRDEMKYCGWLSGDVKWGNVASCKMSRHFTWCNAISCDVLSCDELSFVAKWGDAMAWDLMSLWCDVAGCEVMLCGSKWLHDAFLFGCCMAQQRSLSGRSPFRQLNTRLRKNNSSEMSWTAADRKEDSLPEVS